MTELLVQKQKRFRAAGMVVFSVALGLLASRIVANLTSDYLSDTLLDVVFTLLTQVVFLLIVPFVIYKLALGKSFSGVLELSNFRKTSPWILLLCVPLGVCCIIVTMGVSTIWYMILTLFGFSSSSSTVYPETFSIWLLLLNIFLTGVLPGFCEEFTNRGGFLTVMRGSFGTAQTILLCGLEFGLFHQNVTQVFYTFVFGMLMATLCLYTRSVFPGMIVHFMNNSISVYLDFAEEYSLPLGGFFDNVNALLTSNFGLAALLWLLFAAAGAGMVFAILKLASRDVKARYRAPEPEPRRYASPETVIVSAEGEEVGEKAEDEASEPRTPLSDKMLYKPVLRDWAFYIGALVVTIITTVCTFAWGL